MASGPRQYRQPIRWEGRATTFAGLRRKRAARAAARPASYFASASPLIAPKTHPDKRAHKYIGMVIPASRKYGVDESLTWRLCKTESSFNPYAVSHADALGLDAGGATQRRERCFLRLRVSPARQVVTSSVLTPPAISIPAQRTWQC